MTISQRIFRFLERTWHNLGDAFLKVLWITIGITFPMLIAMLVAKVLDGFNVLIPVLQCCLATSPFALITVGIAATRAWKDGQS